MFSFATLIEIIKKGFEMFLSPAFITLFSFCCVAHLQCNKKFIKRVLKHFNLLTYSPN